MSLEPKWLEGAYKRVEELEEAISSCDSSIHELEAAKAEAEDELGKLQEFIDVIKKTELSEEVTPYEGNTLREQVITALKKSNEELSGYDLSQMLDKDRRIIGTVLTTLEEENLIHEVRQEKVNGPRPRRYFALINQEVYSHTSHN